MQVNAISVIGFLRESNGKGAAVLCFCNEIFNLTQTTMKRDRDLWLCIEWDSLKLIMQLHLPVGCELTLAGDSLAVDDATICVWLDATVLDWDCDRDELFAVWCGGVDCCDCECNCDWVSGNCCCCCCCETSWLICWWWCNKGGLCDRSGVPDPVWISSYTKLRNGKQHSQISNELFLNRKDPTKKIESNREKPPFSKWATFHIANLYIVSDYTLTTLAI